MKNTRQKTQLLCAALAVLNVLAILWLMYFKYRYGMLQMQSDDASNLVYARLLSEGNFLFSTDWYFPTEFNVADGVPIYAVLFRLFPARSWLFIETLGNGIVLLLCALAALWLGYLLQLGAAAFALPLFVLVPTFADYIYYAQMQGADFYQFGVLREFLLFDLLIVGLTARKKAFRIAALAGFAVCAFIISLSGLRFMEVFALPLVLAVCALTFVRRDLWSKEADGLSPRALAARLWQPGNGLRAVCCAAVAALIALAGYLINDRVLSRIFRFDTYGDLTWQDFDLEPVAETFRHFLWAFGFTADAPVTGLAGLANLAAFVLLAMTLFACWNILRRGREYSFFQRLMPAFWLAAGFVYLFINLFVYDKYRLRYLIHFFPFYGAALLVFLVRDKTFSRLFRGAFAVLLAALMLIVSVNAFDYYKDDIHNEEIPIQYLQQATDTLLAEGYDFGYASFWDANVVTYISNGQIAMCSLNTFDWWYPYEWLNRRDYVQNGSTGKVFLLLSAREYDQIVGAGYDYLAEEYLVEVTDRYVIFGYENTEQLKGLFPPMPE